MSVVSRRKASQRCWVWVQGAGHDGWEGRGFLSEAHPQFLQRSRAAWSRGTSEQGSVSRLPGRRLCSLCCMESRCFPPRKTEPAAAWVRGKQHGGWFASLAPWRQNILLEGVCAWSCSLHWLPFPTLLPGPWLSRGPSCAGDLLAAKVGPSSPLPCWTL